MLAEREERKKRKKERRSCVLLCIVAYLLEWSSTAKVLVLAGLRHRAPSSRSSSSRSSRSSSRRSLRGGMVCFVGGSSSSCTRACTGSHDSTPQHTNDSTKAKGGSTLVTTRGRGRGRKRGVYKQTSKAEGKLKGRGADDGGPVASSSVPFRSGLPCSRWLTFF